MKRTRRSSRNADRDPNRPAAGDRDPHGGPPRERRGLADARARRHAADRVDHGGEDAGPAPLRGILRALRVLPRLQHPGRPGPKLQRGARAGPRVAGVPGRQAGDVPAAAGREVPRWHRFQRGGREVEHRAHSRSPDQVTAAAPAGAGHRGGNRCRPADGGLRAQEAVRPPARRPGGATGVRRLPDGREAARTGVRPAPGGHRPLPVRRVGARLAGDAGAVRRLLGKGQALSGPGDLPGRPRSHRAPHHGADGRGRHRDGRRRQGHPGPAQ